VVWRSVRPSSRTRGAQIVSPRVAILSQGPSLLRRTRPSVARGWKRCSECNGKIRADARVCKVLRDPFRRADRVRFRLAPNVFSPRRGPMRTCVVTTARAFHEWLLRAGAAPNVRNVGGVWRRAS
jgi:hypothetical protein